MFHMGVTEFLATPGGLYTSLVYGLISNQFECFYTGPMFGKFFTFKFPIHNQQLLYPFEDPQKKKKQLTCPVGGAAVCRNLP